MSSPAGPKAKVRDLERVRQNQQRSRQRKRAYVLELESKVARLSAQLGQTNPSAVIATAASPQRSGHDEAPLLQTLARLRRENDARRDLLLALGVAASAQDLFLRAFAMREATPQHVANIVSVATPPSTTPAPAPASLVVQQDAPSDPCPGDLTRLAPPSAAADSVGLPYTDTPDVTWTFPDTRDEKQSIAAPPAARPSDALAWADAFTSTLEPSVVSGQHRTTYDPLPAASHTTPKASGLPLGLGPSLAPIRSPGSGLPDGLSQHQDFCTSVWGAAVQADDASLAGTTACSVAFSMILKHNARSLPMAQIESRLRIGYRGARTVGADCRVDNSVLFSVLAEVS